MADQQLFVVIARDAPDSRDKRPLVREKHLAYWAPREAAGTIVLAGPMTDFAGSLFILRAESSAKVREWMRADPYCIEGVFESFEVHPFKGVLPRDQWS